MAKELFELDSLDSLVRLYFARQKPIELKRFKVETFEIPPDYAILNLIIGENYASEIREQIEPVIRLAEEKGCNHNLYTAVYEAVLNAYQHGNRKDPKKKTTVAYKLGEEAVQFAIIDQGRQMDPNFIPYILRHKAGAHKIKFLNYYEFTGKEQPKTNNGTGTSFMHEYVDKVEYFKAKNGGLVVHLTKEYNKD
jgi:anti-sigma regulatory factor (Ser/Thr protein kinase)